MSLATCECHLPGRFEVLGREGAHSTIYVGRGGRKGWRLPCQAGCAELSFTQNSQFVGGQVKPDEIKPDSWSVGSKPIGYVICVNPCLNMTLAWGLGGYPWLPCWDQLRLEYGPTAWSMALWWPLGSLCPFDGLETQKLTLM